MACCTAIIQLLALICIYYSSQQSCCTSFHIIPIYKHYQYHPTTTTSTTRTIASSRLSSSSGSTGSSSNTIIDNTNLNNNNKNNDASVQWELFERYHAFGKNNTTTTATSITNSIDKKETTTTTTTSWKGIWTTYDYLTDVIFENFASVNYVRTVSSLSSMSSTTNTNTNTTVETNTIDNVSKVEEEDTTIETNNNNNNNIDDTIQQTHTIVIGSVQSDCTTCFDSVDTKDIPVATYNYNTFVVQQQQQNNNKKIRLGSCGMVIGPTIVRNGIMATELVLSYKDTRVRVIFQHAPVWEKGIEPGSCAPQGLKLYRTIICKEANRLLPPTKQNEQQQIQEYIQQIEQNQQQVSTTTTGTTGTTTSENDDTDTDTETVLLYRPVPPYKWFKKWYGTCWTWGLQYGNQGWKINELNDNNNNESSDETWHGYNPIELWNLRLIQGGIFVSCPKVITSNTVCTDKFRLAWLPNDNTLLRLEISINALQPIYDDTTIEDDDDDDDDIDNSRTIIGYSPPTLASYRCDTLYNGGDLDDSKTSFLKLSQQQQEEDLKNDTDDDNDQWQ